ncbi:hypothetical protein [Paramylibacter kogurei]|nr:hypothetical protein [Amylibacter kogurei]
MFGPKERAMPDTAGLMPGVTSTTYAHNPRRAETNTNLYLISEEKPKPLFNAFFATTETPVPSTPVDALSFGDPVLVQLQNGKCHMKLGQCKTSLKVGDDYIPVLVQTGHQNGLWYQTLRHDKERFPYHSYSVMSQTVFTADETGLVIDLNSIDYSKRKPVTRTMRRVE